MKKIALPKHSEYLVTEVHERACRNCPSIQGTDPEVMDILRWPEAERMATIFPCGWRPWKYCKGYFDTMLAAKQERGADATGKS